mmetsp:Transcript_9645/g.20561  ORF Transcript_9645/g.20561 Transcript_9645/m.20561 type:complete len:83 (-) Transcript_9645:1340-1588(-)
MQNAARTLNVSSSTLHHLMVRAPAAATRTHTKEYWLLAYYEVDVDANSRCALSLPRCAHTAEQLQVKQRRNMGQHHVAAPAA